MIHRSSRPKRSAVAVVETAFLLPLMLLLLVGLWDVGRMIQASQILSDACRQGIRLAAQGQTITFNQGTEQYSTNQVYVTNTPPNPLSVADTVRQYLTIAGINTAGVADSTLVTYADLTNPGSTQPYQAVQGDQIVLTVTVPWSNIRWTTITAIPYGGGSWGLPNPPNLSCTLYFYSLQDLPFVVNPNPPPWSGY